MGFFINFKTAHLLPQNIAFEKRVTPIFQEGFVYKIAMHELHLP